MFSPVRNRGAPRHERGERARRESAWECCQTGRRLGRPGFGSQVSNWLGAPHSQSRMQRFCAFRASAANTGLWKRPEKLVTAAAVPPTRPLRKNRRCNRCSSTDIAPDSGSLDSEGVHGVVRNSALVIKRPEQIADGIGRGVAPFAQERFHPALPRHPAAGPARPETLRPLRCEGRGSPPIDPRWCPAPAAAVPPSAADWVRNWAC
jgi:hypothetical protein